LRRVLARALDALLATTIIARIVVVAYEGVPAAVGLLVVVLVQDAEILLVGVPCSPLGAVPTAARFAAIAPICRTAYDAAAGRLSPARRESTRPAELMRELPLKFALKPAVSLTLTICTETALICKAAAMEARNAWPTAALKPTPGTLCSARSN